LSEEERSAYCERFPMPAYFGGENPLCIEEYTGQWKNNK
jgi:hypothetical protein